MIATILLSADMQFLSFFLFVANKNAFRRNRKSRTPSGAGSGSKKRGKEAAAAATADDSEEEADGSPKIRQRKWLASV